MRGEFWYGLFISGYTKEGKLTDEDILFAELLAGDTLIMELKGDWHNLLLLEGDYCIDVLLAALLFSENESIKPRTPNVLIKGWGELINLFPWGSLTIWLWVYCDYWLELLVVF